MTSITPHLWFDRDAVEAAELYTSVLPDSRVTDVTTLRNTPSGDTDVVTFELCGQRFQAISAGPLFRFTPAISFAVRCGSAEEVDRLWEVLADRGNALMPLGEYPFSERFGWTEDRYGLSWQLMAVGDEPIGQRIVPMLLFTGEVCGRAEEAMRFYASVFPDSEVGEIARYGADAAPDAEGTVMYGSFTVAGQELAAMDSAHTHEFGFNEAVSLMVGCDSQEELDRYWEQLSALPEAEQCGWLKDRFGVSWQIVPNQLDEYLARGSEEQIARVTEAFLRMKKFDLAELRAAYEGAQAPMGGAR